MKFRRHATTSSDYPAVIRPRRLLGRCLTAALIFSAAALGAAAASADDSPGAPPNGADAGSSQSGGDQGSVNQLQTVIVTARLRRELASQTPAVITALPGTQLEQSGITDMSHLGLITPNVNVATGFLLDSMHIRGVGTTSSNAGFEQQVGLFIDGVYYGNGHWITGSMLDVSSVEVLKGPQGVYLGKNTIAGAFNIATNNPGPTPESYVKAGYEPVAGERYVEGMVSTPIDDAWGVRFAARGTKLDGWMTQRETGEDLPGNKDLDARLTLSYHPTDSFDANLKIFGDDYHDLGAASTTTLLGCGPGNVLAPMVGWGPASGGQPCGGRGFVTDTGMFYDGYFGGEHVFTENHAEAVSLDMHSRQSFGELTSVTGWNKYSLIAYTTQLSSTPTGEGFVPARDDSFNTTYSEELHYQTRLQSPVNFLLGAYYDHTKFLAHDAFLLYPQSFEGPGMWSTENYNGGPGSSLALFGEIQWALTDTLHLDLSARWTRDKKDFFWNNVGCGGFFCALAPAGGITDSQTNYNTSPQATLRWQPNDSFMAYAAYKTGYLGGGYSATGFLFAGAGPGGFEPASDFRFGPEKVKGGEMGTKFFLDNRRAYFDLDLYYYTYTGLQVNTFDPKTISFHVQNAGEAKNQGVELSGKWLVGGGLNLSGNIAFNKSYYAEFIGACLPTTPTECTVPTGTPGAFEQDFSGQPTDFAPRWAGRVAVGYDHAFGNDSHFHALVGLNYSDGYLVSQFPIQPAFVKVDAQLSVDHGPWTMAVIGQDLNNAIDCTESAGRALTENPSEVQCLVDRAREVRIELTRRF